MGSTVSLFAARSPASCFAARSLASRLGLRSLASTSRLGLRSLASRLGLQPLASRLGFLSRFDLFLSCFECTFFVNGMASMGSEGILVVCSDGLIGYDDAYL